MIPFKAPVVSKTFGHDVAEGDLLVTMSQGTTHKMAIILGDQYRAKSIWFSAKLFEIKELPGCFGDQLSFFGAIDQQELLPRGSAEEIEDDVRTKIEILGQGGGYMIAPAHIVQSDTSPESVEAFIAAARKHGRYG